MIIHLNGMPGVGKLTVSRILAQLVNGELIDNHILIDEATKHYPHGSREYLGLLAQMRQELFKRVGKEVKSKDFVFTNALSDELPEDRQILEEFADLAAALDVPFIQVLLTCALETNKVRVQAPDRQSKGKLKDPNRLEMLYDEYSMCHPAREHALALDTTVVPPEETAGVIANYIKKIKQS